jgi:hypothetical protein
MILKTPAPSQPTTNTSDKKPFVVKTSVRAGGHNYDYYENGEYVAIKSK